MFTDEELDDLWSRSDAILREMGEDPDVLLEKAAANLAYWEDRKARGVPLPEPTQEERDRLVHWIITGETL